MGDFNIIENFTTGFSNSLQKSSVGLQSNDNFSIDLDKLPEVITTQVAKIQELELKIQNSDKSARVALEKAENLEGYRVGKWGFRHGDTKTMVTDVQEAVKDLAKAQGVSVEALQKTIELQKQLTSVTAFLFNLGCANISANRVAVRTIRKKLQEASEEEISDLARQELQNVIKQLTDQQDLLERHEQLKTRVKENRDLINDVNLKLDDVDKIQNEKLDIINDKLKDKDVLDEEQSQRLDELKALLDNKDLVDEKQEESIRDIISELKNKNDLDDLQTKRLDELEKLLENKNNVDQKQEEKIQIIFDYMKTKDILDEKQSRDIEKALHNRSKLSIFFGIICSITFILTIINTLKIFIF